MGCCGRCLGHKVTRGVLKFLFSNWGLCILVTAYIIIGAFIFIGIEADGESGRKNDLVATASALDKARAALIHQIGNESVWRQTDNITWRNDIKTYLDNYQLLFVDACQKHSYPGFTPTSASQLFHGWSIPSAILFTCTILTTIGYGHVFPVTETGQLVVIFYSILALPLMTMFLTNVGGGLADVMRFVYNRGCCYFCRKSRNQAQVAAQANKLNSSQPSIAWEDPAKGGEAEKPHEHEKESVPALFMLGFVISYVVAGLLAFSYWSKWTTLKGGYFCMISMLTIGFGDVVPGTEGETTDDQARMIVAAVYIVVGLAVLATGLDLIMQSVKNFTTKLHEKALAKVLRKQNEETMYTDKPTAGNILPPPVKG